MEGIRLLTLFTAMTSATPESSWHTAYVIGISLIVVSYLFRTILFIALWPRDLLEWSVLGGSAALLLFFGTLGYWLISNNIYPRPEIYPPLVVAAWITALTSFAFAALAWHHRIMQDREDGA
jgi:hypothetical protein